MLFQHEEARIPQTQPRFIHDSNAILKRSNLSDSSVNWGKFIEEVEPRSFLGTERNMHGRRISVMLIAKTIPNVETATIIIPESLE